MTFFFFFFFWCDTMELLKDSATLDTRSLAASRLALGCVVVCDALGRLGTAGLFLSDAGLVPRAAAGPAVSFLPELFMAAGTTAGARLLLLVLAVVAGAWAVGWRTRLTGWLTWLLVVGVHARNRFTLHDGDVFVRVVLFFANFLPLAEHFSVDSGVAHFRRLQREKCDAAYQAKARKKTLSTRVCSVALVCALVSDCLRVFVQQHIQRRDLDQGVCGRFVCFEHQFGHDFFRGFCVVDCSVVAHDAGNVFVRQVGVLGGVSHVFSVCKTAFGCGGVDDGRPAGARSVLKDGLDVLGPVGSMHCAGAFGCVGCDAGNSGCGARAKGSVGFDCEFESVGLVSNSACVLDLFSG